MAAFADLLPSVLGVVSAKPGEHPDVADDPLGLGERLDGDRRVCVVLVDGLGAQLLQAHADSAPFLAAGLERGAVLEAGFPSTTATSLGSLGTGLPPGGHGLLGYQVLDPSRDVLVNELRWDPAVDPKSWQPRTTVFEAAVAAGVEVARAGPAAFDGSGLTEAALRGGRYLAAESLDDVLEASVAALSAADGPMLAYAYWGALDTYGHVVGLVSEQWRAQLAVVDSALERAAASLPPGAALIVTADHGMLDATEKIDVDELPELMRGVRHFGGEPRARYLYVEQGAADDVAATWRSTLGDGYQVVTRDAAVAAGWFGPTRPELMARIGDVVVVPTGAGAIVARQHEPLESGLVGFHGARTPVEREVPLIVLRGRDGGRP